MSDQELRDELHAALRAALDPFIRQPMSQQNEYAMRSAAKAVLADFGRRHPMPFNTGITAADDRSLPGAGDVPGDWEMWCDGWDVTTHQVMSNARIDVEFRAINPTFRPPMPADPAARR